MTFTSRIIASHHAQYISSRVFKHPTSTTKGFTLIEVLIAMTLLSIMVVLLFASLKICADSWEKGERKIAAVNEGAVVYNFFQRHLSVARPLRLMTSDENSTENLAFRGDKQAIQFVSAFPASANKSGLQLFAVVLHEKNGERFIEVNMTPFFVASDDKQWREETAILLKHVRQFQLGYFGSEDGMSEGLWQDEWLDKSLLPQLVKINIELDNDTVLPEIIIPLKTNASREPTESSNEVVDESDNSEDASQEEVE